MPFPSSLDSFATILSNTEMDDSGFEHDVIHNTANDAIEAIEAKVGTGSSTPASNTVLRATGTGTSGWGQVATNDLANNAVTVRPAAAAGSTTPTTTNTSIAAIADPTVSITIPSGMTADVYVWVSSSFSDATGATIVAYHVRIGGGSWQVISNSVAPVAPTRPMVTGFHVFQTITAGTYSVEIGNNANAANSITHYPDTRRLVVVAIAK